MAAENRSAPGPHDDSAAEDGTIIAINGMHKWFGEFHVLKDINLEIKRGERIVICGLPAPASRR